MVTLRPFQAKLKQDVLSAWAGGAKNVMPVLPTGGGKTVLFGDLIANNQGATCAIAHRQELTSQISLALARNGIRHRVIGATALKREIARIHLAEVGRDYTDHRSPIAVAGVDTLINMDASDPWFRQVTLIVEDEGHHVLAENKWGRAAAMFPNARGLFPTATPKRADGKGLGRDADGLTDALVEGPTMRELIDMGYLTDYKIYAPPCDIDLASVKISSATGDYNAVQLRNVVHESASIVGDVVAHYLRLARGKLGVTFAVDVADATKIAAAFRAAGVSAEVVSAKTPAAVRSAILRQFKNREVMQLVNVDLFGEGFDLPAIEVVSMARPTQSFSLFCQQFGRALRLMLDASVAKNWGELSDEQRLASIAASTKPHAIIIDHVSNVVTHGLPDARREWSLERRERRSKNQATGVIPCRTCLNPLCLRVYERVFRSCPFCQLAHVAAGGGRSMEQVDGDLIELDPELLRMLRGEADRIDAAFRPNTATPPIAQRAAFNNHTKRQTAQKTLRASIALWAGYQKHLGREDSETYRRFYFKFGTDIATAQTLNAADATELTEKINLALAIDGVVTKE